jgi:ADP-glucose pyrophosphorylase
MEKTDLTNDDKSWPIYSYTLMNLDVDGDLDNVHVQADSQEAADKLMRQLYEIKGYTTVQSLQLDAIHIYKEDERRVLIPLGSSNYGITETIIETLDNEAKALTLQQTQQAAIIEGQTESLELESEV